MKKKLFVILTILIIVELIIISAAPDGFDLNYGSNWPLRGVKNTLWEGGTRLSALIWSPFIQNRVSYDLLHAQDWLPTIYEAAGNVQFSKLFKYVNVLSMINTKFAY